MHAASNALLDVSKITPPAPPLKLVKVAMIGPLNALPDTVVRHGGRKGGVVPVVVGRGGFGVEGIVVTGA